jgi:predicted RNA-binding Zn-ribbon protein involved in translation (DUF1610 family)
MPTSPEIVRYSCPCGYASEELLRGRGVGPVFDLVESVPCRCGSCRALLHRFLLREDVSPERARREAASRGEGGLLPVGLRPLLAIAGEAEEGRIFCPLCREGVLALGRKVSLPCPDCGGPLREEVVGRWK